MDKFLSKLSIHSSITTITTKFIFNTYRIYNSVYFIRMFLFVHLFIIFKNNSMTTQKQIECCNHKKLLLFMSKQQNFYSAFMIFNSHS